jgi:hypothetical protein
MRHFQHLCCDLHFICILLHISTLCLALFHFISQHTTISFITALDASTVLSIIVHSSDFMWVLCLVFWMGLVVSLSDSCQTGDPLIRMEVTVCLVYWYVKVSALDAVSYPFCFICHSCLSC